MIKSKAIVFPEKNKVSFENINLPEPKQGEILVRTEISAVSIGTEMWIFEGKYPCKYPIIPGYQRIGKIVAVGKGSKFKIGDVVLLGHSHVPESFAFEGVFKNRVCAHTEYAVADERFALKIPMEVDILDAAYSWVVSVSLFGVDMARVKKDEIVYVVGGGLIGQMSSQISRYKDAKVLLSEPSSLRRTIAKGHSADYVIDPSEENSKDVIKQLFGELAHIGIEATGLSKLIVSTMQCIRQGGRIVLQGYYPKPITFSNDDSHSRYLSIFCPAGWRGMYGLKKALNLIKANAVQIRNLGPKKFKPEDATEVYRILKEDKDNMLAVYFDWL